MEIGKRLNMALGGQLELTSDPLLLQKPKAGRSLSEILADLAEDKTRDRVSVRDLLEAMHDRAFGALMFIFAVPNCLPTPPGTSAVLGAPLLFLALQLALGLRPWLPRVIADRSMPHSSFATVVEKVAPWLARAERLLRPRFVILARKPFEYLVGVVCFILAVVLVLPIPLGNMLPSFAVCLMALGLLARDGIWIVVGIATAFLSLFIVGGVVLVVIRSALFIFTNAFG